jgi:hypothetical protein
MRYVVVLCLAASVCNGAFSFTSGDAVFSLSGIRDLSALPVGDNFLGPGTVVPTQNVSLSGQNTTSPEQPLSNLTGTISFWDEPFPPLQLSAAPGCCGLLLNFPTGGLLPQAPPATSINFSVLDLALHGTVVVLKDGTPQDWDYRISLASPASGALLLAPLSDIEAVVADKSITLNLTETFTSPSAQSYQRPVSLLFNDGPGTVKTVVPEPGTLFTFAAAVLLVLRAADSGAIR